MSFSFSKKFLFSAAIIGVLLGHPTPPAMAFKAFASDKPAPITEKALLGHLEKITAWQRNILSINTTPDNALEKLLKDTLQRSSGKVLQYGFEFARAQASILSDQKQEIVTVEDPKNNRAQINRTVTDVTNRIADIQKEQTALESKIRRTPRRAQTPLLIQREKLASELKIAIARQALLKSLVKLFDGDESTSSDDVLTKINNLSLTVPGAAKKKAVKTTDASATPSPAAQVMAVATMTPALAAAPAEENADVKPPSKGLIGTVSDMLALYRKKQDLAGLINETSTLHDDNREMIDAMRMTLQQSVARGNELTQSLTSADKAAIETQRAQIDDLVDNFKQLSIAVVPLGQVNVWLEASERDLQEWRGSLDEQLAQLTRTLLWQGLLLGLAILIPLLLSEIVRRAIKNYVQDSKRQRQLHIARRSVFMLIVGLIILLNFVTEFSSLATFAGFLTAGMAVALQNVILSGVAHFFYFGRFGVRIGDRVTIKGFTGEVVQVGLIRLYMMELGGPEAELYPTGKIVSFPNSILFQSEAFSKQIDGAEYSWQEITFLLDPSSDHDLADQKLNEAVTAVYAEYQEVMDRQKMALTRMTHLNVTLPAPKGYLSLADNGLAFVIRYPIHTAHIDELNERITHAILHTIEQEPALKLASTAPPKIESVDEDEHQNDSSDESSEL